MTCFAHVECSHSRCFHQAVEYVELDLGAGLGRSRLPISFREFQLQESVRWRWRGIGKVREEA